MYTKLVFETFADKHCASLPEAEKVQPFGPDMVIWRVNGHMFAAYTDDGLGLSLRTNDANTIAISKQAVDSMVQPSLTGDGWVVIPWETPIDELRARIDESYNLVRREWKSPSKD